MSPLRKTLQEPHRVRVRHDERSIFFFVKSTALTYCLCFVLNVVIVACIWPNIGVKRRIIASTVGEVSITKAITGNHSHVSSCLCRCVTGINIGSEFLFYAARTCSAILESSRSVVSFVRRRSYAKRTCVRTCAYTQVSAQHTVEYRSPNRLECIFLCSF